MIKKYKIVILVMIWKIFLYTLLSNIIMSLIPYWQIYNKNSIILLIFYYLLILGIIFVV